MTLHILPETENYYHEWAHSCHGLQHLMLVLIHMVWWASTLFKTECQRQWLYSHQDQTLLSADAFGLALTDFVPVWLPRPACWNSNKSNFQRRFYSDGSGRREGSSLHHPPLLLLGVEGGVGLELELHNGCLSELIKQKMLQPLSAGKHGHKWGRMLSVHVFEPGHRTGIMSDESYVDVTAHKVGLFSKHFVK